MTGRRKISTTIYLTEAQSRDLHRLTVRTGVPMAEYIRRALDALIGSKDAAAIIAAAARAETAGGRQP